MEKYVMLSTVIEEIQEKYPTRKFCCYLVNLNETKIPHVNYYETFSYCIAAAIDIADELQIPLVIYNKDCRDWLSSMMR